MAFSGVRVCGAFPVDSHVGRAIFENILSSETGILRKKTRVLVTNNLSVLPFTDSIFVLKEGQIIESGSYGELLKQQGHFAHLISEYSHSEEAEEKSDDSEGKLAEMNKDAANFKIGSKLVEKEDSQTGRVKWSVYWQYLKVDRPVLIPLFTDKHLFHRTVHHNILVHRGHYQLHLFANFQRWL